MALVRGLVVAAIGFLALIGGVAADYSTHQYNRHERVPTHTVKVGPFANPQETYEYYSLPFCQPKDTGIVGERHELGEVLKGDRKTNSAYDIRFRDNNQWVPLCDPQYLSKDDVAAFKNAIANEYLVHMSFDDLPVWVFVGARVSTEEGEDERFLLFTHIDFAVTFNNDQVISVNVSTDASPRVDLSETDSNGGKIVEFSYSVKWVPTEVTFANRFDQHPHSFLGPMVGSAEIHWLSIINSFVLVLLLTVFLAFVLMRILKKDFARYESSKEDMEDDAEETGWKLIHGDVFRPPPHLGLFCAFLGNGAQLGVLVFSVLFLSVVRAVYPSHRGALYTVCIITYALTAGVNGYVSNFMYKLLGGRNWVRNTYLSCLLFSSPLLSVGFILNTIAAVKGSTAALPFGTIVLIIAIWALITFPLTVLGGIMGRNGAPEYTPPCRINKLPRDIPPVVWYRQAPFQVALAGLLPFSAIFIELHYMFQSIWGHQLYTLYGILFLVFVLLFLVTCFVTVALTYFQLAVEDYHWWWRSFFSGAATGVLVFLYSWYYYVNRSEMFGVLQTSFFFGYMALVSYAGAVMLGAVGFFASAIFVNYIYRSIKID